MSVPISIAAIARRTRPLTVAELIELSRDPAQIQAIETAFNSRLAACQEAERRLAERHAADIAEIEARGAKLAEAIGVPLRDWFAGCALMGMHACTTFIDGLETPEKRARTAYIDADAMLKERSKP